MEDIFLLIKEIPEVKKVCNLYPESSEKPLDFFFFICPRVSGSGIKLNHGPTGFTVGYSQELSKSGEERILLVKGFLNSFTRLNIPYTVKAIFADADSLVLFPIPAERPTMPVIDFETISNFHYVLNRIIDFGRLYRKKPWQSLSEKIKEEEARRLKEFLPTNAPALLVDDFVKRTWSGFALDGIIARSGAFGENPVLLGVENGNIPMFQNSALSKNQWLPLVQIV